MATNDLIPLFFSDHTEEPEQLGIGNAWDTAAISTRILNTSILVVTAAAIAVLLAGNPFAPFVNATASLVDTSAPQDGTAQSMPIIQLTADAQALPPTAREPPTGAEIAAVQDARAQVVHNARAQTPPAQKHRHVRRLHNARADVRPVQKHREVRSVHARQVRSEQDAQVQDRSVQNAQTQWPETQWPQRKFGWLYD